MTKQTMKLRVVATMITLLLFLSVFTILGVTTHAAGNNGWVKKDGEWFYYQNGVVQKGWLKDNSVWYYLKPNTGGAMASDDIVEIDGYRYYFAASGRLIQNGWYQIKNNYYWENLWIKAYPSGALKTGWLKEGNSWYYLTPFMLEDQLGLVDDEGWYYFNKGGAIRTKEGWFQGKVRSYDSDTYWFYANAGGILKTGWFQYKNNWYYFNDGESGPYMVSDEVTLADDGRYYYFNDQGVCRTQAGWIQTANWWWDTLSWFYVQNGGPMKTGWFKYYSNWYYMDPQMYADGNYRIGEENYTFDANGVWVP